MAEALGGDLVMIMGGIWVLRVVKVVVYGDEVVTESGRKRDRVRERS